MLAFPQIENNPQVIVVGCYIMQGCLDLKDVEWDKRKMKLCGILLQFEEEKVVRIIAGDERKIKDVKFENGETEITSIEKDVFKVIFTINDS